MPIDYKKYPKDWKTRIRPDILKRAENKCEMCGVENGKSVWRGEWCGEPCYQYDDTGVIHNADDGDIIGINYVTHIEKCNKGTIIVLTIAHLDHDINNNDYGNLKALCQRCHLHHDKGQHGETRRKKKGTAIYNLF